MTDTKFVPITFKPGIVRNTTELFAEGGWVDCDNVRFRNGRPEKMGGRVEQVTTPDEQYLRDNFILVDPLTTTNLSSTVEIAVSNVLLNVGDTITINSQGTSPFNGIALSGDYTITAVVGTQAIQIDAGTPATGSGTGGGIVDLTLNCDCNGFFGVARDINSWSDLQFNQYLAVATHLKVELYSSGTIYDLTPIRDSFSLTGNNHIETTINSSLVEITFTSSHDISEGDVAFLDITGATTVGGITLSGIYQVTRVISSTILEVNAEVAATSSAGPIGDLDIDILLDAGPQSNGNLGGWGSNTWGTGIYGAGRSGTGGLELRQWSLDNYGEDLIGCVRNGGIYLWDASANYGGITTRMQNLVELAIADAAFNEVFVPQTNLFVLVSQPTRFVIAFGSEVYDPTLVSVSDPRTFDPLVIRWASQETFLDWEITPTNSAGEIRLPKGNTIVGAAQTRSEILVFTDTDVYSMRYVGGNEVFRIEPLGTNVSSISQHASVDVNGIVYWLGLDDFYMYDGVIKPLESTLDESVFDQDGEFRLLPAQKEKVFAGVNKEFHEVWWLFQSQDGLEIDRYVVYNYLENLWYDGYLDRTVWLDRSVYDNPFALDERGILFSHENGKDDNGNSLRAFIRSGYFDMGEGDDFAFADEILPDIKLPAGKNIEISVLTKKNPHPRADIVTKGPFSFDDTNNTIKFRARGRQMAVLYDSNVVGGDFELGKMRLSVQPDGER